MFLFLEEPILRNHLEKSPGNIPVHYFTQFKLSHPSPSLQILSFFDYIQPIPRKTTCYIEIVYFSERLQKFKSIFLRIDLITPPG